jgi:phage/plasmid primase-like uncharacterized protein
MTALDRELIERARANDILAVAQHYTKLKRAGAGEYVGPCPVCGGTDRFSININKGVFNCRGCTKGGDVIALLVHATGRTFTEALQILTGEPPPRREVTERAQRQRGPGDEADQHRKAGWLWSQAKPIAGSTAERYLRGRGISGALPATLRYLPARDPYPPALIAALAIPDEPEPGLLAAPRHVESVHLIKILPDGSDRLRETKAKITIGMPCGRPVVLSPVNDLCGLAITEGIENALTIAEATGLGVWASCSAPHMPALAASAPAYVETVTIFADADADGQGERGAMRLAQALRERDIEVRIEGLS